MFELFAQGDRSLARSEGGLGIGLTLVQRPWPRCTAGRSRPPATGPGRGSEFVVRLPAAAAGRAARAARRRRPARRVARRARGSWSSTTTPTPPGAWPGSSNSSATRSGSPTTALEAIEAAREYRPAVVLLDIGLPGMDGYQVATRLREDPCCRDALIIAVTGYGQDQDRRGPEESGFDHHLVKPVDYEQLVALMAGQSGRPVGLDRARGQGVDA